MSSIGLTLGRGLIRVAPSGAALIAIVTLGVDAAKIRLQQQRCPC